MGIVPVLVVGVRSTDAAYRPPTITRRSSFIQPAAPSIVNAVSEGGPVPAQAPPLNAVTASPIPAEGRVEYY